MSGSKDRDSRKSGRQRDILDDIKPVLTEAKIKGEQFPCLNPDRKLKLNVKTSHGSWQFDKTTISTLNKVDHQF